jgi:phosphoribosylamine--glycine ligase
MMRVLIVGGGGREHALAWKLSQSPRVERIFVAPGNGGTDARNAQPGGPATGAPITNVPITEDAPVELIDFARSEGAGLTVIGPEAPLAAGITDAFQSAGLCCFGPSEAAARLETSKAFAKSFMIRHGIPTARFATFTAFDAALAHLRSVDYPVVLKASGLAAGKGVILPQDLAEAESALRSFLVERAFGSAGDEVIIEERLTGPEVSLLGFSDGRSVVAMPPAQDHKRIFEGDQGPNTGGMGAYAPVPWLTPDQTADLAQVALQRAVDGLAAEGTPYVGVLYAGLMLTPDGPRVLEYNCRFGDPETQVILPLLASDLLDALEACVEGRLADSEIRWHAGACATVVAASEGYPGSYPKGLAIDGTDAAGALPGVTIFHAGTRWTEDGVLVSSGGRVLAATGYGSDLRVALDRAYAGIGQIHFAGMHTRRDIGAGSLRTEVI